MEVIEAMIPSSNKKGFLFRLSNSHPKKGMKEFENHKHSELEIVLFKEGRGHYKLKNKEYDVQKGDIFMFSSNEVHCLDEISPDMHIVKLHFEPRFIWSKGNDLFDSNYLRIFLSRSESFENRLDRANPATKEISEIFLKIEDEFYSKRVDYELMVKAYLLMTLVKISRDFGYSKDANNYNYKINFELIENSIDFINENFKNDISLDDIAASANLSKVYFSNIFKKLNGVSPWEYLIQRRIEEAIYLIKTQKQLTLMQIASKSGFNNTANFNHSFKKYTGKSPKEYKTKAI